METNDYKCFCMASVHRLFLTGVVTLLFVLKLRKSAPSQSGQTECSCIQTLLWPFPPCIFTSFCHTWCHMAWRIGPHCFWSIPLLAIFLPEHFTASNESLYFLLQYHSISLGYLKETTRKGHINSFQRKGSEWQ